MKLVKRILKITGIVLVIIVLLAVISYGLIQKPTVQTWLVNKTTAYLTEKLHTKVSVGSVNIALFKTLVLNDVYVEDRKHDTILSAGNLKVSIGLFEVFRKKFVINSISLNDVTFNMIRLKDSADFNFQFIIDALASKDTIKSKTSSPPPDLNLKEITLTGVRFHLRDEPSTDLAIYLPSGQIDINKFDLKNPTFDVKNLILNQPDIKVASLVDSRPYNRDSVAALTYIIHLNTKKFRLLVNNFKIINAHFKFDDESEVPDTTKFDTYHMDYHLVNLFINNGKFIGDSIVGEIAQLSCKEKSGLVVDTLRSKHARVTTRIAELRDLYIRTPNSILKNYFAFNYKRFPEFNYLLTKVILKGDFKNSLVSMADISIFAPQLRGNKQLLTFTGKITGTVDNLRGKQMIINTGNQSLFKGDAFFRGLPNLDETYLELTIDEARTNYADLKRLLPEVPFPNNISTMGLMTATGSFSGFFNDFVAYGVLSSDIGVLQSDLNLKLPANGVAEYSGNLSSSGFNIGKYLGVDSLIGKISMVSKVNGSGMRSDNVSANLLGHVDVFEFNRYAYTDISVDGLFDKKLFTGKLLVRDKNANLDFQGTVNFNDSLPRFNFYATLDSANLKLLNFSKRNFILTSEFNINLSGNSIDELKGRATAEDILFKENGKNFRMDSLILNVSSIGKDKTFSIHSNVMSTLFKGQFSLVNLIHSSIALIGHYFPSLPMEHEMPAQKQDFDYSIKIFNAKPFLDFFLPSYHGVSNTILNGHFNSNLNTLTLDGEVPAFGKNSTLATGILISAETDKKELFLNISANYFQLNDSFKVLNPYFSTSVINDTALINVKANDITGKYRLDVTSKVIGKNDFVSVKFLPSRLVLNNDSWDFLPGNELVFKDNNLYVKNFTLLQHDQSLSLSNIDGADNTTNLRVAMSNVHFEDFYNLAHFNDYPTSGIVNGNIDVLNFFKSPRFDANATVTNFHFNGDSLNKIIASINYNTGEDKMAAKVEIKDNLYDITASGNYIPQSKSDSLDFKIEVIKAELPVLNKYLADYVSSIEGKTAGKLFLKGTVAKPQLSGSLIIPSAKVKVNYLQTAYTINGAKIEFKDNLIDLGDFTIYDKDKNPAKASGEITHEHLTHFRLDIQLNTDKFLLLHTVKKDNPLFFGTAYGGGLVKFTGPINNLDISATLQSKKGTVISIPITDETSISDRNFIRFVNDTTKNKPRKLLASGSNLSLNFDLDITPDAQVKIIFDQRAGDIISGNGNGDLRLEINTAGKFNMYGNFAIAKGDYLFTMQNFLSKKFSIQNGSTISWSGDPYQAKIGISAIYTISRASIADLGVNQNLSVSDEKEAQRSVPVNLYMNLTGSLLSPSIAFKIDVPDYSTSVNSYAATEIDKINQDENELNKQVFGLLMLNRFLPSNTIDQGIVTTGGISSLGEFITNQLSYWLSQNKYNVDVNVTQAIYGSSLNNTNDPTQAEIKRSELQLALTKRFFNNRISVDVGGNLNYDAGSTNTVTNKQQSNVYLGDFTVEYQITPDGRFTLKGFYRSNYDIIDERNLNKWGGAFAFKREFDRIGDLFRRDPAKKKKKTKTEEYPLPANKPK